MLQFIFQNITHISLIIIVIVFLYFLYETGKLYICKRIINKSLKNEDILDALSKSKLAKLTESYKNNITININNKVKTNIPASEYFNETTICKEKGLNLRMLDIASGTLVGLGLLGTFAGLTLGIKDFDSSSADNIQQSIQSLLGGMGTAFATSLAGMFFSIAYSIFFEKPFKNGLYKAIYNLTENLDTLYYIDDISLMQHHQGEMLNSLQIQQTNRINTMTNRIIALLNDYLTYTSEQDNKVPISNAIREILKENTEQSKALKSFSTDLALQLNEGFDESLSRQMQQKILPLMENVDATTRAIVDHIDKMAEQVSSPATDMIQAITEELKENMNSMMSEFKNNLSDNATTQIESLATSLGAAVQSMIEFPKNMENVSATLQVTIEEVKTAISEISNTSTNSNNMAMQQMQEQIAFATSAISTAIAEVKEVMSNITNSSEQSSKEIFNQLAAVTENMGTLLNNTMSNVSSSIESSMKNISDDVVSKQTDLLALQELTMNETQKLLSLFNDGLEKLDQVNNAIGNTMNTFQLAQGEISGTTSNLRLISGEMKTATEVFHKAQGDYVTNFRSIQEKSQQNIDAVTTLLKESGEITEDNAEKFEIIRKGLSQIFAQLQSGLGEYSQAVRTSLQDYLNSYSVSLTKTAEALSNTIQQQNDVVEMLVESMNKRK